MATENTPEGDAAKVLEGTAHQFREALFGAMDPDDILRMEEIIEAAPRFRPVRALSASGKLRLSAAAAAAAEMQDAEVDTSDSPLMLALITDLMDLCESMLRVLAVDAKAYDKWSASIPVDIAAQTIMSVFESQMEFLGKL